MGRRRNRARRRGKKMTWDWFKKLKTWQKALLCIAVIWVCLLGSAVLYVAAKWNKIDTQKIEAEDLIINQEVQVQKNKEVDLGSGYKNVALFGVDSRDGNLGKGNRTDCIIVASLNNETKEIKMVSVYRDTLLDLSEGTYQKCNAAYSYGGPVMAINMLNMNLDLDIEDYVTVDFGAIADAIDLLGGVEIDLKEEEVAPLNKYINETARSAGKKANRVEHSGLQLLDGSQATTYARIRSTAGGDFTRTERQRLVIEKMFEKALEADLGTINKIIDKVFPQVSTSFTLKEILMYASAYSEYKLGDNMGFPFDKTTDTLSGLGSIVIPQDLTSNVTRLHEFLFGAAGYTPSSTVQRVSGNIVSTVQSAGFAPQESGYDTYEYEDSGSQEEYYDYSDSEPAEPENKEPVPDEQPVPEDKEEETPGAGDGSGTEPGDSSGETGDGGTGGETGETENGTETGETEEQNVI